MSKSNFFGYKAQSLCWLLSLLIFSPVFAEDKPSTGTLIVCYQAGCEEAEIDRIRFWLINDKNQRVLYPKKEGFVDDHDTKVRKVVLDQLHPGQYIIEFVLPNINGELEAIPQKEVIINPGEVIKVEKVIKSIDSNPFANHHTLISISTGPAIIGDPFNDSKNNEIPVREVVVNAYMIGVYEVTNGEYAQWLSKVLKEGKILYEATSGIVKDKEGHLICKTLTADPLSQIIAKKTSKGILFFSIDDKEEHPAIHVSWYGASMYCEDLGFRLPTEVEWEKAAGMAMTEDEKPLKKYRYGFGQDIIDPSWANYKQNDTPIKRPAVLTTPIGFFNGKNKFAALLTHDAKSPYGCYDMSGNVWEWVSDAKENDRRVVKGGCYDSLSDGVRVAEQLSLPSNYSDIFTGFRVAK